MATEPRTPTPTPTPTKKALNLDEPPRSPLQPSAASVADDRYAAPPRRRAPQRRDEVADLRRRATAAASKSKTSVTTTLRLHLDLYRALVELAEEYGEPLSRVMTQCMSDGLRKYKTFSSPGFSPFRPAITRTTHDVTRAQPSLTSLVSGTATLPAEQDDEADAARTQLNMEQLASSGFPMGALLPSRPPLREIYRPEEEVQGGDAEDQG